MKTSIIIYVVLILLLVGAILSLNNLNSTLENIKNDPKSDVDQISGTQTSREVVASELVSRLRDQIKKVQSGNQPVSSINVEFYQPTN